MHIRFDYRCPDCGFEEERFVEKRLMDNQQCPNYASPNADEPCYSMVMTRLPAAPATTFRFNDRSLKK